MNIKKLEFAGAASAIMLISFVGVAFAKIPGAAVKNPNANTNACWGMDRSFYASAGFFPDNMDIKQSFPPAYGKVGEQRAAWAATYCDPHGPVATPPPACEYSVVPSGADTYPGRYGGTVTPETVTHEDCSVTSALRTDVSQSYGPYGWAGWSCVEVGYPNVIGGGYDPISATISNSLAWESGAFVGAYTYPTTPWGYSYAPGETGWIVQAGATNPPTSIYVVCGQ